MSKEESKYDQEFINSLIGTTIEVRNNNKWKVVDQAHGFLFLVREGDGYERWDRCEDIQKELEEKVQMEKLKAKNPFQKMFDEHGCYQHGIGEFVVGGKPGSWHNPMTGVSTDERTIKVYFNQIDGYVEFGGEGDRFGMAHTFVEDKSRPWGYRMVECGDEVHLDQLNWMSIDQAKELVLKLIPQGLETLENGGRKVSYVESKNPFFGHFFKDSDPVIVFHPNAEESFSEFSFYNLNDDAIGFRFSGLMRSEKSAEEGPNAEYKSQKYIMQVGALKGKNYQNGRNSRSGMKWAKHPTKGVTTETITWGEMKERLVAIHKTIVDKMFELTARQKFKNCGIDI